MSDFSIKEIELYSKKILEDYDNKIPGLIFKEKKKISNEDALLIQSNVAKLRKKRGEEIIGYKIGCVSKDTQKKMGFNQPACGYLWKSEMYDSDARGKDEIFGFRTHKEHITVPLIYYNSSKKFVNI